MWNPFKGVPGRVKGAILTFLLVTIVGAFFFLKKEARDELVDRAAKSQLVISPALSSSAVARPEPIFEKLKGAGIASGQRTGTNWLVVEDIVRTCSTEKFPLRNIGSNGSEDNINLVYSDRNSQFGIAQVDALLAQKKIVPGMMARLSAVFPLFSSEVHAITAVGSTINSLADMEGKQVIEGPTGSGTRVTVQLLKEATGIKWRPVPGDILQDAAVEAVKIGAADVAFVVAGKPVRVLSYSSGIRLIPIEHPKIDALGTYTKTLIPSGTYPWLGKSVRTYKVNTALITFAYKNQYQEEIKNLVGCMTSNLDTLKVTGHPKWREVDPFTFENLQWPMHPIAIATIKERAEK